MQYSASILFVIPSMRMERTVVCAAALLRRTKMLSIALRQLPFPFCIILLGLSLLPRAAAQGYAIGADVSFLAKCEQDGVVFKENGKAVGVLALLREHHYNWVRLRLFHDPAASADKLPNDLPYTLALAKRSKAMGFHLLLDLHYSDTWADPGKQFTPAAWSKLKHEQLVHEVYAYTRDAIAALRQQGVLPDMVQVGNEITNGMLWPDGKLPDNWDNLADLLNAGIRGVAVGSAPDPRPRIMIHIERSGDYDAAVWFFDNLIAHHVPFDVIGLSYYPFWHGRIAQLRGNLHDFALRYRLPIIIVETAYNWTPGGMAGKKTDFPESPEGQLAFLRTVDAAVRAIPNGLGRGVFWWEPAAEGGLRGRGFFDDDGNVLPVITAFDSSASP
ncbi:MAG: glycosyl hydrolase 53 family protein [Terracidiphilus sp.]|jgi:arabinogalactan endo-1,4-beta-galactosidase